MKLKISETFESIQGEGRYAGVPSLFIRTSGCNLRCWWCDTPYTSHRPEGGAVDVGALVAQALASRCDHVVVTGGEPMLFPDAVAELVGALRKRKLITIETNGTVYDARVQPDLWSASPKLASSTPLQPGRAQDIHRANIASIAVDDMKRSGALLQVKFVATTEADVREIKGIMCSQSLTPSDVWLMPEGRTREEMLERGPWAAEVCKREGWNLCLRQHVLLWGAKRGV